MSSRSQPVLANGQTKAEPSAAARLLAVRDAYLMATPDKADTPWAILTQCAALIEKQAEALRPLADCEIIECDTLLRDDDTARYFISMGEIRAARAALAAVDGRA